MNEPRFHDPMQVTGADAEKTFHARMAACKEMTLRKIGNPLFLAQTFFTEAELSMMKMNVQIQAGRGFPATFASFQHMAQNMARAKLQGQVDEGLRDSFNDWIDTDPIRPHGDVPLCGEQFFKKYNSSCNICF